MSSGNWVAGIARFSLKGVIQDELLYEGDRYCAPLNAGDHVPKSIAWLKEKMNYKVQ